MILSSNIDLLISRGCLTPEFNCSGRDDCYPCYKSACNNQGKLVYGCHKCNGSVSSDCYLDPSRTLVIRCNAMDMLPMCYTFFDSIHQTVHRGCASSTDSIYTSSYVKRCVLEPDSICASCNGIACNYFTRKIVISDAQTLSPWPFNLIALFYTIFIIK